METSLHADTYNNFYVQLHGRKRFLLLSPAIPHREPQHVHAPVAEPHFLALGLPDPDLLAAAVVADEPPAGTAVVPPLEERELGRAQRAARRRGRADPERVLRDQRRVGQGAVPQELTVLCVIELQRAFEAPRAEVEVRGRAFDGAVVREVDEEVVVEAVVHCADGAAGVQA